MSIEQQPAPPPHVGDFLVWTDALATGVKEIDDQHRDLFDWLAELERATCDQRMMTAAYAMTRLVQYTRSHFVAEEALMRRCAYPGLTSHLAEHQALCDELRRLQAAATSQDLSQDMVVLLRRWLINHVLKTDMDYVPFVRATQEQGEEKTD